MPHMLHNANSRLERTVARLPTENKVKERKWDDATRVGLWSH